MRLGAREREAVRRGAARAGLEAPLRAMWEHFNPAVRRDRIDNEHIRLLLSFALREDANCIDIGAHSGVILREMLRVAPRGHHIAYEPLPQLASQLTAEFPSVEVRNAAVSNENGEATFFQMVGAEMQSALKLRTGTAAEASRTFTVRVDKLDDALPADYVPALIKIDVEGAERQVLEGAMETLRRHAPIVAFEHGPGAEREYDTSPGQVYDLLVEGAGMRIFDIDGAGPYSRTQFVEIFPEPIWNFVAHR